ncbi:MAG TPA: AMP-binding protein [Clostridiales bacterium]|nr:AMP-binding protein [Clostridiales bacterium]
MVKSFSDLISFFNIKEYINQLMGRCYPPERDRKIADLRELVYVSAKTHGDRPYLRFRRDGEDFSLSFVGLQKMMERLGTAFLNLGIRDGAKVAVIGETSPEWIATYLATVNSGNVIVPLDRELTPDEICNFINRADVRCVICSPTIKSALEPRMDKIPNVRYFGVIPEVGFGEYLPCDKPPERRFVPFRDFVGYGCSLLEAGDTSFKEVKIERDAMCAILFTSGTTGTSKGVMLSHRNIATAINGSWRMIDVGPEDVLLSVLPIHHTYEMTCGILTPMLVGCTVCINDSLKNVTKNMQYYKPTILILVPLFVNTIYKRIIDTARKKGADKMLEVATKVSDTLRVAGVDLRRKLFAEIMETFGGRLEKIVCGGAPLNPEMIGHFESFGINLTQGYGITECAPLISVCPFNWKKDRSVGLPIPGLEVVIDVEDTSGGLPIGEILVRGDNVMLGYYNAPELTKEAIVDGWFRTGDYGYMDADGFLYITGRKKNVIVLENGKNVYPEEIEEHLEKIRLVGECVVVGRRAEDGESIHITALIYPDFDYAKSVGLEDKASIEARLKDEITALNKTLPSFRQIRKFELRDEPFPKTTSRKIIRHMVS